MAMMGIKLNAQVMIKNLNLRNMHEKSLPPTGARSSLPVSRLQGGWSSGWSYHRQWSVRTGPGYKAGDHTQADATTAGLVAPGVAAGMW